MAISHEQSVLETYADAFTDRLTFRIDSLVHRTLLRMDREVVELVGPDPGLRDMWVRLFRTNLQSLCMAIRHQTPLDRITVAPITSEYARMVAQRGVPPHRLLMGQQVCEHSLIHETIECAWSVAQDQGDLAVLLTTVLAYAFAHSGVALQQGLEANAAVRASWHRGRGAGLSRRLDQVLDRQVTDTATIEQMLNYRMTGDHVAVIAWRTDATGVHFDLDEIERMIRGLPGNYDSLVVPRDEQTLVCWLRVPSTVSIGDWTDRLKKTRLSVRFALGAPASGLDGFLNTYRQAHIAANVLVQAHDRPTMIVRYGDISAISFLIGHPSASRAWVENVLGDLSGPEEDRRLLRHTLHIFLEEGENATAAAERLYVHRNTVKYRTDRALRLLPNPLEDHRLDVSLALTYCEWIPLWDEDRPVQDNPVASLGTVLDLL